MNRVGSRRIQKCLAACGLVALLAVLAGCGSSSPSGGSTAQATGNSSASSGSDAKAASAAATIAAKYTSLTKIGPTKPITKAIPKGKKLIWVNCGVGACTIEGKAFSEAAKVLGWTTEEIHSEPTPEAIQAAFREVIRRKPDGVASAGFGPALYPQQIAQLNAMKIPVMEMLGEVESGVKGVAYDPIDPGVASEALEALANKAIADMGGKGEAGVVLLTGYPNVKIYTDAWENELKKKCPSCSVVQMNIQPTAIGKNAPEQIVNFVRANPNIKALLLSFDPLGKGLGAALKAAGVNSPLLYSFGPEAPGIEELKDGERTAAAVASYVEGPWQLIDGFARVFVGESPIQPPAKPVIWSEGYHNVPASANPFPVLVSSYKEEFEALWGMKK